jgi:hypothetical protein
MNGGTGVVPNLDSIEEFRLLTNNFDPEYGNYNGGIVNVVTKSGSDSFRGNFFEFFRNTHFDARNYFSPERAEFKQNQPGGTVSGPLRRGKLFFFADYQATRTTQGIETDTSLLGTFGNGVNNNLLDTPNYAAGCDLKINHDPSKGPGFNTDCFSLPALGQRGNAPRRMFHGPGIENFDLALIKQVKFGQQRYLEIRLESFNLFNHPQFYGAGAVDGNIVSPTFGQIITAAAPRFIQLAAKFTF